MNFSGKSVLLIGPGDSTQKIDIHAAINKVDKVASINDVILKFDSDIHFVGEKYIFDYVYRERKEKFNTNINFFFGLNRDNHEYKITSKYFKSYKSKIANLYYCKEIPIERKRYPLPSECSFNERHSRVLATVFHDFPNDYHSYVRSKILGNALQVLLNLNFDSVYLIGFMDSKTLNRDVDLKKAQSSYLPSALAKKTFDPATVFDFQRQLLRVINYHFKLRKKKLFTLCPQECNYALDVDSVAI